ncbi:MAG: 2-C-methyl-D-erythritol 4-phosphate cytidylyltransferase, partial [Acetatifactor sp.]|nr:2-C-methyl-D-erythritol 4-phosphate cytidylyltransferase [Acetatifactor sp.]
MNTALILSGGTGSRMGLDTPKQYLEVGGRILLEYCLLTLAESEYIDAVQIVADQEWQDVAGKCVERAGLDDKFRGFSKPGANRQQSILNGLE